MNDERRVRWRMTYQELLYLTRTRPDMLEHWATLGALGPRWKEPRDRGKWRHVTRECAQRAVIMSRLVQAGVLPERAAEISANHTLKDETDLVVTTGPVTVQVRRDDLP